MGGSAYVAGGDTSEAMVNFQPPQGSADGEVLRNRHKVTARARDLTRNNGWAAGGVAKEVDAVIGATFRPLLKPDWQALGLSPEWAAEFKRLVEARWRSYADDPRKMCDTTRAQTAGQMFAMAYRNYLTEGDAIGLIGWKTDRLTHTTLRVVDPDLLSMPDGAMETAGFRGGVEMDESGAAVAYHFRQGHPKSPYFDLRDMGHRRFIRDTNWGRPRVLHFFDKMRDGQTRGISRLAPIIETLRMEGQYARTELQAAILNAALAAYVKTPLGPDAIDEMFGEGDAGPFLAYQMDRQEFYSQRDGVHVGGAKLTGLFPGDEIGMVETARPAAQFSAFSSAVLRQIASGLGISYEQLAADWSKTNYSSARAAMVEIWRGWTARRVAFAQGFCQPFFMAWLEEEVDFGRISLPDGAPPFEENWAAYSRAKWIGSGKGFVDPVKEAQAAAMRVALGLSTLEEEAAELTGSDWVENMAQIEREIAILPEGSLHPVQESFAKLIGHNGGPSLNDETTGT
ncbi:MAG: phage portal protein [Rhodobacteraceae bacterium]|nr:phage portal protein [Paracoccaceae bacterium]MAY44651.1 phage portal protein [Paracoccaceae bacterium]